MSVARLKKAPGTEENGLPYALTKLVDKSALQLSMIVRMVIKNEIQWLTDAGLTCHNPIAMDKRLETLATQTRDGILYRPILNKTFLYCDERSL